MDWLIPAMLCLPAAAAVAAVRLRDARALLSYACAAVFACAALDLVAVFRVFRGGPVESASGWLRLDALSAFHLAVLAVVFGLSTAYARVYFGEELSRGRFSLRQARQFASLWIAALAAMQLTLFSNNLGMMWVGMESTTLLTAFLICLHVSKPSLEAMWKYIIICSVGVGFAFMGTLLFAAASVRQLGPEEAMLWTRLSAVAANLDPALAKAAFLFVLVGYGTKAGLAPMHNWLPDAHSQAPTPVSAIFSGFMLNTALYCVMRYLPITEAATGGAGWALSMLRGFGLVSILVAAAFIMFQHDLKRLLAYSSVEHLGIITLGLGFGGIGSFAAMFHTLNHSLCKTVAFFAAGRLGQIYGSHDMRTMSGSMRQAPLWGATALMSILALIGVAPFAIFMSELQIAKAAMDGRSYVCLALFLLGAGIVFIAALGHAMGLAWGSPRKEGVLVGSSSLEKVLAILPLACLLLLGLWMPQPLRQVLEEAAKILGPAPAAQAALSVKESLMP